MAHKPTKEQEAIYHYIGKRSENVVIKAYAGTGKSTTIVEAVKLIPNDKKILFLAFNKHIQEELKEKLPEYVRCSTTYAIGVSAIHRKYPKIKMDEFKIDKIISKKAKSWGLESEFKVHDDYTTYISDLKKMVNFCRLTLTTKAEYIPYLMDRHDINLRKKEDIKRILKILDAATIDRATYDFTDMIFLPAIDNSIWFFPQDYVFVDEAQDMNRCQIKIIEKCLKRDRVTKKILGRLISVGDKFQNIYGFNCSDDKAFEWFENYQNSVVLPLSYSFRCPHAVIRLANEIVPDIKALESAIGGIVREGDVLTESQSGDLILCRTTTPLIKLFFHFLVNHKKAYIRGNDIGIRLIELIGSCQTLPDLKNHWDRELKKYQNDLYSKGILNPRDHSGFVALEDKVTTLLFIGGMSKSIENLKTKIQHIFSDEHGEGIILSTIHKAKGSESKRVFIVRPDLIPLPNSRGWQYGQEMNLKYVAITRAKEELIFDKNWTDEEDTE